MSKYLIDCVGNHESSHWDSSKIRSWQNNTFLKEAFTEGQRGRICLSTEKNDEDSGDKIPTVKDPETEDRAFLLSAAENEKYLCDDSVFGYDFEGDPEVWPFDLLPTDYAISRGNYR